MQIFDTQIEGQQKYLHKCNSDYLNQHFYDLLVNQVILLFQGENESTIQKSMKFAYEFAEMIHYTLTNFAARWRFNCM